MTFSTNSNVNESKIICIFEVSQDGIKNAEKNKTILQISETSSLTHIIFKEVDFNYFTNNKNAKKHTHNNKHIPKHYTLVDKFVLLLDNSELYQQP